ncbi:MAG: hypothetical protein JWO14_2117 [Solirubrobacterales bacterium]|nr:hypothetical protein [Solirubrobacterales bacterium]
MANSLNRLVTPRFRAAALMPAAVLTVHQARFVLAFGGSSGEELEKEGHQYLSALAAPIAMSVAIVVGLFFARLASAWRDGAGEGDARHSAASDPSSWRGFLHLTLLIAASLLALYSCQELFEGMLSNGHPEGFNGVFGDGGWWAVPLSLVCGLAIAAALRGARAAIRWVASRRRRPRISHERPAAAPRPRRLALPRLVPLAGAAAGRAPPFAL